MTIFVPTRRVGEEVRTGLAELRIDVPSYHERLLAHDRDFLLGRFSDRFQPQLNAIICTNAFGMGVDIPNIRTVIHWVQPESVEDYLAGIRTSRT